MVNQNDLCRGAKTAASSKASKSNLVVGNSTSSNSNSQRRSVRFEPGAAQSENNSLASVASNACTSNGSTGVNNSNTLARWPLAKYANLILSKTLPTGTGSSGTWQERSSARLHDPKQLDDIWIQITQRRYVQIVHGDLLLENCSLASARQEWQALRKGPNMLFIVTRQGTSRKFRIRFLHDQEERLNGTTTKDASASAAAQTCARHLSRYFSVHDADGQGQIGVASEDNRLPLPPCQISLQELSRAILEPQHQQHAKWPPGCSSKDVVHESIPDLVRSCLLDPGFASFVEAVEKSLKILTTPCLGENP